MAQDNTEGDMLIYLDANIVQYCADYEAFLFGGRPSPQGLEPNLLRELRALRELIELEQLGNWEFAASDHLLRELHRGHPTHEQLNVYQLLEDAAHSPSPDAVAVGERVQLMNVNFTDNADRRHVATALAMGASWFITNDRNMIVATSGRVRNLRIARPSECLEEISVGLFLRV